MMFVRNFEGIILKVDSNIFLKDKEFYEYLWKLKYNITFEQKEYSFNAKLISYIKGDNFFI